MKRAALYMRISTKGHGQSLDTQAVALREYAERRGFQIADEYRDEGISGGKDRRPELDRMMADARKRRFDAVLVARFDRFARSTKHLVMYKNSNVLAFEQVSRFVRDSLPRWCVLKVALT
jgi:DNA invertase Pin-like site-specific DNA recombinase